ncbi:MAG: OB-fold nucleic acid binding domain-containing protein [Mycobacteriales bacterium]
MGERGWLARTVRRFVADESDLDAEELQQDVVECGAKAVSECHQGALATVRGRVRSVVFKPKETVPTLEAELWDGSGSVTLVWFGRRQIAGIEPGRTLIVRGRVARRGEERLIYNPWYELEPSAP